MADAFDLDQNIIAQLGLQDLPEEKRLALLDELAELVEKRVMIRLMEALPETDVPEADKIAFAEAFQADQENIDEFLEWAVRGEMLSSEDLALLREDQQAIEDVGRGLHVEILNATLGLEAGYRLAIEADNQLAEALGHFDVAEDMWEVWQANGKAGGES